MMHNEYFLRKKTFLLRVYVRCLGAEKNARKLKQQIKLTIHLLLFEDWKSNFCS